MTPAARVQGAIELVDAILAAARTGGASADRVAGEWFRARRYAGSGDRRAIRELAWRAAHMDRLAGDERARRAVDAGDAAVTALLAAWREESRRFAAEARPYHLYR